MEKFSKVLPIRIVKCYNTHVKYIQWPQKVFEHLNYILNHMNIIVLDTQYQTKWQLF